MRPLWRETSTRQQNAGLKKRSHRPHVHMRVRGPNMGLRTSVRPPQGAIHPISWRPLYYRADKNAMASITSQPVMIRSARDIDHEQKRRVRRADTFNV